MKNTILILVLLFCSFPQDKKEEHLNITIENLIGAYGGDEETENAYFGIYKDSVYYPDSNLWSKLKLKGDTIILTDESNYVEKLLILKLTTDSLIVFDLDMEMELHLNRRGKK